MMFIYKKFLLKICFELFFKKLSLMYLSNILILFNLAFLFVYFNIINVVYFFSFIFSIINYFQIPMSFKLFSLLIILHHKINYLITINNFIRLKNLLFSTLFFLFLK